MPEVRERFRVEFQKPGLDVKAPLAAPPLTKSYSLTGIAFDYLLRFYVKKLNPRAVAGKWAAEDALELLKICSDPHFVVEGVEVGRVLKRANRIMSAAKAAYRRYLRTPGRDKPGEELIAAAIGLAQLDPFYRAAVIDVEGLGKIDERIVADLKNILALVRGEDFFVSKVCLLNPAFGDASELVGGADADLVIDSTLIEVKTTKYLRLDRPTFNQLMGYYLLYRIGGIEGLDRRYRIDRLGVYYSRHGIMFSFPVERIIRGKVLSPFIRWFRKNAAEATSP